MPEERILLRCQAASRQPPDVVGLDAAKGEWQLAVARHHELLIDVTGHAPTDDLDLQELATITARLEGYVHTERHRIDRTHGSTQQAGTTGVRSWLVSLLTRVLPDSFSSATVRNGRSSGNHEAWDQYDIDRVYQLSRFFRAMMENRREELTTTGAGERETMPTE